MSTYSIQIDDEKIMEQIAGILDSCIQRQLKSKYSDSGKAISEFVKDMVYKYKDQIIEEIVKRATAELVRKGLPKLIDSMTTGANANESR